MDIPKSKTISNIRLSEVGSYLLHNRQSIDKVIVTVETEGESLEIELSPRQAKFLSQLDDYFGNLGPLREKYLKAIDPVLYDDKHRVSDSAQKANYTLVLRQEYVKKEPVQGELFEDHYLRFA